MNSTVVALLQLLFVGLFIVTKPDGAYILKFFTMTMFVIYNIVTACGVTTMIPGCSVGSVFVLIGYVLIVLRNPSFLHKNGQKFHYNKYIGYLIAVYLHVGPVAYFYFLRSPKNVRVSMAFFLILALYLAYYRQECLDIYGLHTLNSFQDGVLLCAIIGAFSVCIYDKLY